MWPKALPIKGGFFLFIFSTEGADHENIVSSLLNLLVAIFNW